MSAFETGTGAVGATGPAGVAGVTGVSGASAATLIEEITAGAGGLATVDFQSIPNTYRHLEIYGVAMTENAAVQRLMMRFNNDSGTNYFWQSLLVTDTTVSAEQGETVSAIAIARLTPTAAVNPMSIFIRLPYYKGTTWRKEAIAEHGGYHDGAPRRGSNSGLWADTSAINRITFLSEASDIKESSIFSLYGLN